MKYSVEMQVPHAQLAVINGYLAADSDDKYQGEDNTIINSVSFPDGCVMDIKCCGCRDESSWTEAVLFAPAADGYGLQEIGCSEPGEEYKGVWELEDDNTVYSVSVVDGGDIAKCSVRLLNDSDFANATLRELQAVMVKNRLAIRTIPMERTAIYEVRYANEHPDGRIVFLEEYGREMLVVRKKPKLAGKVFVKNTDESAILRFNPLEAFDTIADVLKAVAERSLGVNDC